MKSDKLCPQCAMPLEWIDLEHGQKRLFCGETKCKSDAAGVVVDTRMGQDINEAYAETVDRHKRRTGKA